MALYFDLIYLTSPHFSVICLHLIRSISFSYVHPITSCYFILLHLTPHHITSPPIFLLSFYPPFPSFPRPLPFLPTPHLILISTPSHSHSAKPAAASPSPSHSHSPSAKQAQKKHQAGSSPRAGWARVRTGAGLLCGVWVGRGRCTVGLGGEG